MNKLHSSGQCDSYQYLQLTRSLTLNTYLTRLGMNVAESNLTRTFSNDTGYLCSSESLVEARNQQTLQKRFEEWVNKLRNKASARARSLLAH